MKKLWWIVPSVLLLGAGGWWWYHGRVDQQSAGDLLRRTAVVRRDNLVVSISATGTVNPVEKVDVKSKASGEILVLPIEEGDVIRKGALIARLDSTTAQNDYEQTKADFAVAEVTQKQRDRELKRLQELFDGHLASESELDNAKLAYEQATAQLVRARAALSTTTVRLQDTEIHAPLDGVVLSRPVEVGQIISSGTTTVTGGTLLCTVANMSRVYVITDVDETDIGKVQSGMTAVVSPDAFPDRHLQGTVERIAPLSKVQQNVTVFEVTILVDNAENLLKAGMNATVEVVTASADDALIIPLKAIEWQVAEGRHDADTNGGSRASERGGLRAEGAATGAGVRPSGAPGGNGAAGNWAGRLGGGRRVPSVQILRNGIPTWIEVRTGLSNVDDIEILSGLAVGDTVVYSLTSGVMKERADFRQRMMNNASVPGMRRTN